MARAVFFILGLLAVGLLSACTDESSVCELIDNKTSSVTVDYGKAVELAPKLCGVKKPAEATFAWALQDKAVGTGPTYRFLACPRFKSQTTPVRVAVNYQGKTGHHAWDITVRDIEPAYPDCGATLTPKDAMAALQRGDLYGEKNGIDFKTAVACLDRALLVYPCDTELGFWAAYGDLMIFAQHLATSLAVSGISERTLNVLVEERIDPLLERFDLLAAEMPADYTAQPKDFDFSILSLVIHPGGEWDRGDMLALDALFHLAKGGAKLLASYIGSLNLLQTIGISGLGSINLGSVANLSPELQNKLITKLETDPSYLMLYPKEGPQRLAAAQKSLIIGLRQLNAAIAFVKGETDDQRDDKFRYFDCGVDAICPPDDSRNPMHGDPGEILVKDEGQLGVYNPATDVFIDANGNGRYDPAWVKVGPDRGEGDSQYNEGENLGTDAFEGLIGRVDLPLTALLQNLLTDLATNIEGPDALDLTKFLQISQDRLWQLTLLGGINVPSLRISRWFEGPRDLRDFLPLWSRGQKLFLTDSEEEPYFDWGFDHLPSAQEPVTTTARVKCDEDVVPPLSDPRGDDFNPSTNPDDGCDNDEDGFIDAVEPGTGRSRDLGVEGNGRFDFKDTVIVNGRHDMGEESEKWDDTVGLRTYGKAPIGKDNGVWDAIDMVHYWPKGSDVGGRPVSITLDPKNGALQDGLVGLIDPVYYFFPDAQFNGVLIFEEPTENAQGETLSDNAELMRFFSKIVAASRELIK